MKKIFTLFAILISIASFSQANINQMLSWGGFGTYTLPTTNSQTYDVVNLHSNDILIVPIGVNLIINGNINNGGKVIFMGYNTLVVQNIYPNGIVDLRGNTCLRVYGQVGGVNFIGSGVNNLVNYNVPANWGFSISAPNITFSNNTSTQCSAFVVPIVDCSVTTTWNGTSWTNGLPTNQNAVINGDYNGQSFSACSLLVNNGKTLIINDGISVVITNSIINNGNLIVENNGNLIQKNDLAINSGGIIVKRNTEPVRRTDYTYWGSPVSPQTLHNLSPLTMVSKFFSYDAAASSWTTIYAGNTEMLKGKGYIVRAPQTHDVINPSIYHAEFNGVPNNGVIQTQIIGGYKENLIGNPYPSSIDARKFILANPNLTGALYFWTHNTPPSNSVDGVFGYTNSDYATFNLVGGVGIKASTNGVNQSIPNGYIASGQGFFVKSTVESNDGFVLFNNSMRSNDGAPYSNNQFFRMGDNSSEGRYWLNLTKDSDTSYFSQTLVGYVESASDSFDPIFDAIPMSTPPFYISSIIDDNILTIQGKSIPFQVSDFVPLGLKFDEIGISNYTIKLDSYDGIFNSQIVYIEDMYNNTIHNLTNAPFHFSSINGDVKDRFRIRYDMENTLNLNNNVKDNIKIYSNHKSVKVESDINIDNIKIYDLFGRIIFDSKINNRTFASTQINVEIAIIKVTTENGVKTQKIIIR